MFTLECMPKDADLFFEILNQRNHTLNDMFIHTECKYNSIIECTLPAHDRLLTFRQIDIKDCVSTFSKISKYQVYRVTTKAPFFIMSQVAWLSEDLALFATYGASFVKDVQFKWEEQHSRSKTRLLLNITT